MNIHLVDTSDRRDVERFVRLPFKLYRDAPNWVPPLLGDERAVLDQQRHPFYQHSTAAFFLAEQNGEVVGRIAVANNRNYNAYCQGQVAFFNAFEAASDPTIADALFAAAFDWARAQRLTSIQGPKGFLHLGGRGLLVQGFEHRPAVGIAYHHPTYQAWLEKQGLVKLTDYLSGQLHASYELPERFFELAERVRQRRGLRIHQFKTRQELRAWIPRFREVYNRSFVDVPGFYPMTEPEMQLVADSLLAVTYPRLVKLIIKGDEPVGFLLSYPNINAALQRARGRLWPIGWAQILWERRHTRWVDFNGIGLLPEHQGVGATAILYSELEQTVREFGYQHANLVQISDLNDKSRREAEKLGAQWTIRHRLYQREL